MTSPAKRRFFFLGQPRKGVALVLVLAFVVLLASIIVAFFSRVQNEQQISRSSANQAKVKLFADGAVDTIVGDLKQQIAAGASTNNTFADGSVFYTITNAAKMVPERTYSGATNTDYANLVGFSGTPMYSGATDRSTNVATTETNSTGRSISKDRWNKPLFLPDSARNIFDQVKWIAVSRKGENTATSSSSSLDQANSITGRYAYVIYDEGGLLDINVAGYPNVLVNNAAMKRKIGLPYVNLTDLKDSAGGNLFTRNEAKTLTDWRDYATGQTVSAAPTPESAYARSVFSNKTGFLQPSNSALAGGESDRKFIGRQQLIDFVLNKLNSTGTKTALQYLTTFSRDLNQPSFVSAVQKNDPRVPTVLAANKGGNRSVGGDRFINPSFPTVRVQTSFTRNDGSTANVGDPLVSKRFSLQRLAWITYKGPSASRNQSDADIQALINNGIPWSYLQQGTDENIKKYFGLTWDGTNNRWKYDVYRGTSGSDRIIMLVGRPTGTGANAAIYVQDANREPNFFELLKAGITLGSLGKVAATLAYNNNTSAVPSTAIPRGYNPSQVPATLRYPLDSSVDYHIIQIGANILSEVNPTSFPVRIAFDDGSPRGAWEFQGVTDLPYLQYVFNGVLIAQPPKPDPPGGTADNEPWQFPWSVNSAVTTIGNAYMIQVPAVWNPYDPNGTPGVLRPSQFRIVIDSNDPLHPPGSGDLQIWHGAVATQSTTGRGGPNTGLFFPNAVYSWTIGNGAKGKTTEHPTDPSIGTGNGTPIFDAVKFNDGNGALFREPTVIFKAQSAASGNATRVNALTGATPGNAFPAPQNITSSNTNPLPGETDNSTGPWAPLVLGQFPMAFSKDNTNQATCYTGTGLIGLATGNGDNRVYFTYRLQYQDSSGNWVTYDTKYGRTTHGMFSFGGGPSPTVIKGPQRGNFNPYSWASAIDPRTARFGLITDAINIHHNQAWGKDAPPALGWIYNSSGSQAVATDGITYPVRQDNTSGSFLGNWDVNNLATGGRKGGNEAWSPPDTRDVPFPGYFDPTNPSYSGWTAPVDYCFSNDIWMCAPGMYAQNNPGAPFNDGANIQPCYYADADGVVRRAAGAYVPSRSGSSASTTVGLPPSSINGYSGAPQTPQTTPPSKGAGTNPANFAQSQSRPLLLHRPFRTVAELGYVFRDVPWKNLDFFTPESGDAALLDLFCINETSDPKSLVAGKVNLNTRQAPVLAAIISGAYVDDPKVTNTTVGSLSPTVANSIATALKARTANTTAIYGPLQNVAELIGKWNAAAACAPPPGTTYSPSNPGNSWGVDLPSNNYKDGQKSYVGFSGNATGTTTGKDLSSIFTPTTAGTLMESMAYVQRFREAPIRALGSVGQTRVWNLMIDVVAQSGRYPQSATGLDKFVVEGEQRYWVHVAIDRLTGQVIDKQIEVVKE